MGAFYTMGDRVLVIAIGALVWLAMSLFFYIRR